LRKKLSLDPSSESSEYDELYKVMVDSRYEVQGFLIRFKPCQSRSLEFLVRRT
jgi:hypothetical protein